MNQVTVDSALLIKPVLGNWQVGTAPRWAPDSVASLGGRSTTSLAGWVSAGQVSDRGHPGVLLLHPFLGLSREIGLRMEAIFSNILLLLVVR